MRLSSIALGLAMLLASTGGLQADSNRVVSGIASTYGDGYDGWLALPEGRGVRVVICSKASGVKVCTRPMVSNDAGPDKAMQRAGRVADLDIKTFEFLCKCNWRLKGTIHVTVTYLGHGSIGPQPTLPPTDTEGVSDDYETFNQLSAEGSRQWARPSYLSGARLHPS